MYLVALAKLDGNDNPLHFGPSHVVWDDENFDTDIVEWCLRLARGQEPGPDYSHIEPAHMDVVIESLESLLAVPESVRCCAPAGYDGEHPELFPPAPEHAVEHIPVET